MILSNQIRCRKCGGKPYSSHQHDFRHCECGAVGVDGGMAYLRRIGTPTDYEEMSILISEKDKEGLLDALEDISKNTLGKLCNVARYLRDEMGIDISTEEGT